MCARFWVFVITGVVLTFGSVHIVTAQSWGDVAFSGTLNSDELCYTDGKDIICDAGLFVNGPTALEVSGTVSATAFVGDGSSLTNVVATMALNDLTDAIYDGSSVFIGDGAGANDDGTANQNLAIGRNAMGNSVSRNSSVAIGHSAMLDGRDRSVAIGNGAGTTMGFDSVVIGHSAGTNSSNHSVIIGRSAGTSAGGGNVIIGEGAGGSAGGSAVVIGRGAGTSVGANSFAIGASSAKSQTSGPNNITIGSDQNLPNTTGSNQLNIGGAIYGADISSSIAKIGINVPVPTESLEVSGTVSATAFVGDGSGLTGVGGASAIDGLSDAQAYDASKTLFIGGTTVRPSATGLNNTAVGVDSMAYVTSGGYNTALGANALLNVTSGSGNTALGQNNLSALNTGSGNIAVGSNAMTSVTSGSANIAIGADALTAITTNVGNMAMGSSTLDALTTGDGNIAFGSSSQGALTSGSGNVSLGGNAMDALTSGSGNVAIGADSLEITTGSNSVALGTNAGSSQTGGDENIIIGYNAQVANASGSNQLSIGNTLYGDLANDRIGVGVESPLVELDVSGTVSATAFVGDGSGLSGVSGLWTDNTTHISRGSAHIVNEGELLPAALEGSSGTRMFWYPQRAALRVGDVSDTAATIGSYSIAMGFQSTAPGVSANAIGFQSEASAVYSTAIGRKTKAMGNYSMAIGSETTASGSESMAMGSKTVASGTQSTAMGAVNVASGIISTAMGNRTIASGDYSTAMGRFTNAVGDYSTAIGHSVSATGLYSVAIGLNNVDYTVSDHRTMAIVGGEVAINKVSADVALDVSGSVQYTGTITDVSDRRLKQNIQPLGDELAKIKQVQAVSFEMKDNPAVVELGVIAQDLEKIYPELVNTADDDMGTKSVNYVGLIAPMLKAMQEQQKQIENLQAEIEKLKAAR